MPLIFLGSVDAASDATMATVTNQANSRFRTALEALIAAILAGNQAVIEAAEQAAAAAVNEALTSRLGLAKCIHYDSATGRWVWDGPNDPAATHYIVRVDGRWRIVSTPFPTPSATAPAIDWN